jgi:CubicO group peptidase (beta-lactamase class C family)
MSDQPRPLPVQPSLRYLKLEARRRLAAGEFGTLHDAQLAIAREHGQSSWAALKQRIDSQLTQLGHPALTQLRWVVSRFSDADGPGWVAPAEDELREHFTRDYLGQGAIGKLVVIFSRRAARLREELVVTLDDPLHARARLGGMQLEADAEPEPPYRLKGFREYLVGRQVTDGRVAAPPTQSSGAVPYAAAETAATGFKELGLAGLVLAGGVPGQVSWVSTRGWADLDRAEPLRSSHRFPAYGVTRLVTATAVLRLAAEDQIRLDDAANDHLRTVRLADDAVTIRELLSYAGGVDNPAPGRGYADTVATLGSLSVYGPVLPCSGPRGIARPGHHGGYAALGQLIADVTGSDYAEAVGRLVLAPLGMASSTFPASWPHDDPDAVTGYELEPDGSFRPDLDEVAAIPSAAGLWTTADDLVKFGTGWGSLVPADLVGEALAPQAAEASGPGQAGLGWRLNTARGFAFETGNGPGGSASLIVRPGDNHAYVALTNRKAVVMALNARVLLQDA